MRLLITGGSSYLGQHLVPLATAVADTHYTFFRHNPDLPAPGHALDVRDAPAVSDLVNALQPQVIIHTAGSNRSPDMQRVIEAGTRHVVAAAAAVNARLIHLSTDVVFDGRHGPYREADAPRPLHAYGRAKARAEAGVGAYPRHVVVRTSLIYGLRQMDRGTAWMAAALRAGTPPALFTDQLRNPVWVQTLSRACLELAGHAYVGVLHVAGQQALSRAEFGQRLLDWWQVAGRERVTLGTSDPARWPRDCRLDVSRAAALLSTPLPGVDVVLAQAAKTEQISD